MPPMPDIPDMPDMECPSCRRCTAMVVVMVWGSIQVHVGDQCSWRSCQVKDSDIHTDLLEAVFEGLGA